MSTCINQLIDKYPDLHPKDVKELASILEDINLKYASDPVKKQNYTNLLFKEAERVALLRAKRKIQNAITTIQATKKVLKYQDPIEGIRSLIANTSQIGEFADYNLQNVRAVNHDKLLNGLFSDLKDVGLIDIIKEPDLQKDLFQEMINMTRGDYTPSKKPHIAELAKIFKRFNDHNYEMKKNSGMDVDYREDYITQHGFDPEKLYSFEDRNVFTKDLFAAVDLEKSYPDKVFKDDVEKVRFLRNIADNIVDNSMHITTKSSLDKRMRSERKLVYKNDDSHYEIFSKWGSGNMFDNATRMAFRTAHDSALVSILGTDPHQTIDSIVNLVLNSVAGKGGEAAMKANAASLSRELQIYSRASTDVGYTTKAIVGRNIRKWMSYNYLGSMVFAASGGDIYSTLATSISHAGKGLFSSLTDTMSNMFSSMSPSVRKKVAERTGIIIEHSMIADMADIIDGTTNSVMRKFDRAFAYVNLEKWRTPMARTHTGLFWQKALADNGGKTFKELSPQFSRTLAKSGINEIDWGNISKSKIHDDGMGLNLFTVAKIPDADLVIPTGMSIKEYRNALDVKMRVLFRAGMDRMLTTPGLRESSAVLENISPDEWQGQILRMLTQFTKPVVKLSYDLGGHLKNYTGKETFASMSKDMNAYKMASYMIVSGIITTYFIMQLKKISKGEALSKPKLSDIKESLQKSSALGILGDTFLSYNQKTGSSNIPVGPFIPQVAEIAGQVNYKLSGGKSNKRIINLLRRTIPGQNAWFVPMMIKLINEEPLFEEHGRRGR